MGAKEHHEHAGAEKPARCAILTVSDTRTSETDISGKVAAEMLRQAGHDVEGARIVPNGKRSVSVALARALKDADFVVTIGGTGIGAKDRSAEAVRLYIQRELPGFGEMFRALSAHEIGPAAILSRAVLGITARGKIVCALPGSEGAVRLAFEQILVPELKHLLRELRKR